MQSITSTDGVHVHADLHELQRIRGQLTASQLALWGDHSSRIASFLGLANNDIADVILNDCGLVVLAIENPQIGLAIGTSLTAIWMQLKNLNALCDLVQSKYQVGELTIDRKMALEHQMLEVAATAPFFAKLHLFGADKDADDSRSKPIAANPVGSGSNNSGLGCEVPAGGHEIQAPTEHLPPRPVAGPPNKSPGSGELQDSEKLQSAASYKSNYAQN